MMNKFIYAVFFVIVAVSSGQIRNGGRTNGGRTKVNTTKVKTIKVVNNGVVSTIINTTNVVRTEHGFTGSVVSDGIIRAGNSIGDYVSPMKVELVDIDTHGLNAGNSSKSARIYDLRDHSKFVAHTDDFINLNVKQYTEVIDYYETKLQNFKKSYKERLDAININRDFLLNSLAKTNEHLNPMEILNGFTRKCVAKYRKNIPSDAQTKNNISTCLNEVSNELPSLLKKAVNTKKNLVKYHKNIYEKEIKKCGVNHDDQTANYINCITTVTDEAHYNTNNNQQLFETQLEAIECAAKANIKKAFDCTYDIQQRVISLIAMAMVNIEDCVSDRYECRPCEENTCSERYTLKINSQQETIFNPFYGSLDKPRCLYFNVQ